MAHAFNIKTILALLVSLTTSALLAVGVGAISPITPESAQEHPVFQEYTDSNATLSGQDKAELFSIFDNGDGTQKNPYVITTLLQLEYLSGEINSGNRVNECFVLGNDIDFGGAEWIPIGIYSTNTGYGTAFQGSFDGAGHTISNFKITASNQRYVGFFGLIYNGQVKNLTVSDIVININSNDHLYAGGIAGRCISSDAKSMSITNCHVKNASITANSVSKSSYAGGISGYFMAGGNANSTQSTSTATVENVSVIDSTIKVTSGHTGSEKLSIYSGGLFGYFASSTNGSQSLSNAFTNADVTALHTKNNGGISAFAGGAIGFSGFAGGYGKVSISNCYSVGSANASSYMQSYAGGFTSYISIISPKVKEAFVISDCFTSANAYTHTLNSSPNINYSCIGGFVGETYDTSKNSKVRNCYAASNAVDAGSQEAYAGLFAGYNAGVTFENCYYPDSGFVKGTEISQDTSKKIKLENAYNAQSYEGFDFNNTWSFDVTGNYPYPVLNGTIVKKNSFILTVVNANNVLSQSTLPYANDITLPAANPTLPDDDMYTYDFSHWSLSDNGAAVSDLPKLYRNTTIFAVYNKTQKKYPVSFYTSDGQQISQSKLLEFGSIIIFPEAPEKPGDLNFWYTFSHWALKPDGENTNNNFSVTGAMTFYAVYKAYGYNVWDGKSTKAFSRGNGTKQDPYEVNSAYELAYLAKHISQGNAEFATAHYKVTSNIELGSFEWTPIGSESLAFSGVFDGGGYIIDGLKLSDASVSHTGLFGYTYNATISDIQLTNVKISINSEEKPIYAGALCGYAEFDSQASFARIKTTGSVSVKSVYDVFTSGIVGYTSISDGGTFRLFDSYSSCSVSANSKNNNCYASGIMAYAQNNGTLSIERCYSSNNITASASLDCYASGIISQGKNAYGITIDGCFSTGNITSASSAKDSAFAGHIIAGDFENASILENIYLSTAKLKLTSGGVSGTGNKTGFPAHADNFRNQSLLKESLGFDFENTWELTSSYSYPSLKIERSQKPEFTLNNLAKTSRSITATIRVMSESSDVYSVTLNVYSARGRLIDTKSAVVNNAQPSAKTITLTASNLSVTEQASYVTIVAADRKTLYPLFTAITKNF